MAFEFDVRKLVGPPFGTCPRCGKDKYGLFGVQRMSYVRKCRDCWFGEEQTLWPLSRKIIYIDQSAISDMMKSLNPAHPSHAKAKAIPFWRQLFEKLDRLKRLQVIACPHSDIHHNESLVSGHFEDLRRMYEHLSHNVRFQSFESINHAQLDVALLAWLAGKEPQYDLSPERAVGGRLNDWHEPFIISVSMNYPQSMVEAIRHFRDEVYAKVRVLFDDELRHAPQKEFRYWYARERHLGGLAVLEAVALYEQRLRDMEEGRIAATFENRYASQGLKVFRHIHAVIERHVANRDVQATIVRFLQSDHYKDYPSNRITSLLWASIDQAAANGQNEPPNEGMSNDIQALTLLPFCDAMFIDNGCRGLWEKIPAHYRRPYQANLFSFKVREDFLAYLDRLEAEADPAISKLAARVYGEPRAFVEMYEPRNRRQH